MISPDLDTVTYTLADLNDTERGWGVTGESWRTMGRLAELGGAAWFNLGDLDLATHLFRTQRRLDGATLSEATAALTRAMGVDVHVVPVTDDPIATKVTVADGRVLDFQTYFVAERHAPVVTAVTVDGLDRAVPAPGVLPVIAEASAIVLAPSNPVVSLGPLLGVDGVANAVAARRADVVAISPIVGGQALKGPAAAMLTSLDGDASVVAVAERYRHLAATLVIDHADAHLAAAVAEAGMVPLVTDTIMVDVDAAANLARTVLGATS
jgi:LPPG:FO 2-phospho-L-lactate transferase